MIVTRVIFMAKIQKKIDIGDLHYKQRTVLTYYVFKVQSTLSIKHSDVLNLPLLLKAYL
jgi:hypothetical protein